MFNLVLFYLNFEEFLPLWCDVEHDAIVVPVEGHRSSEEYQQYAIREQCREVHSLE